MANELGGKRVALIVTDGFEQVELTQPKRALEDAGAEALIVSPKEDTVRGWKFTEWGDELPVDRQISEVSPDDFDAVVLPGGQINPDKLRMDDQVVSFVRRFVESGKPVAAICHGPWVLIEAGVVAGRQLTSYQSIRTDLKNAGAEVVDEEAVVDGNLLTSRNPDDLPAFCAELIEHIRRGAQAGAEAGHYRGDGAEAPRP